MTQAEFDALPALLRRREFMAATGLYAKDIRALRLRGELKVLPRPWRADHGRATVLYYKTEAARIGGLRV